MHEHRNDEIVSWVPDGVMRHDDRTNGPLVIDKNHLMVMNAGRSFWHSEETLISDPPLRMLQILVRPNAIDLSPAIQFGSIAPARQNEWRHLVGAQGDPVTFHVHSAIDFFDIRLGSEGSAVFPYLPLRDLYFYVFSGAVEIDRRVFKEAEQGLWLSDAPLELKALTPSIVVAFLINPHGSCTTQGTVGDHRKIPPPYLARPLMTLLNLRERWRQRFAR